MVSCSAAICLDALHCRCRTFGCIAAVCQSRCLAGQGLVSWLALARALDSPVHALGHRGVDERRASKR